MELARPLHAQYQYRIQDNHRKNMVLSTISDTRFRTIFNPLSQLIHFQIAMAMILDNGFFAIIVNTKVTLKIIFRYEQLHI